MGNSNEIKEWTNFETKKELEILWFWKIKKWIKIEVLKIIHSKDKNKTDTIKLKIWKKDIKFSLWVFKKNFWDLIK